MRPRWLPVLLALTALSTPAFAVPRCDHIAGRIASLQSIPGINPGRIVRLQQRYADKCVSG